MKMRADLGILARTLVALSLIVSVVGCGGSTAAPPKPPAVTVTSIAISPANPSVSINGNQQFTALATNSDKTTKDITGSATWSSSSTATATILSSGLATGVAAGTTTITATSGAVSGTTTLTVTATVVPPATLVSIAISPPTASVAVGAMATFTAQGTYSDGTMKDLTAMVTWTSGTPATATISAAGVATGVAAGSTTITATSGTITNSAQITVTAPTTTLVSIAVTTPNATIAKGTTAQFTATGTYSDGTTKDISATATWASVTAATASISATGLAMGLAGGTTVITATSGTIVGMLTLNVTSSTLVSIAVTTPQLTIATGTTAQFTATGTFKDQANVMTTQDLTAMVTWASATVATATITQAGLASGKAVGMTVITATAAGATPVVGMATLNVKMADLMSIAVTTMTPSIAAGTTAKFIATGTFADMTTQDLTSQVAWTSGTPATATIAATGTTIGTATSLVAGTTVISAKLANAAGTTITGMLTLTVTGATLVSITVSADLPQGAPIQIAKNTTVQLHATGIYTDSNKQDLTTAVAWSSATGAAVMISNAADQQGLATAGNVNVKSSSVISAKLATGTGATAVTVIGTLTLGVTIETLLSINVTPAAQTIAAGTTHQFIATGFFSDASQQDVTETAAWASATTTAATVLNTLGNKGLAKGVAVGSSVLTASVGAIKDTATLTVSQALLQSITIDPPAPGIALGTTLTLSAAGLFSDGSKQDLTTTVAWSTDKPGVATISGAAGEKGKVTPVTKGTTLVTATFTIAPNQTVSGTATLTVSDAVLKSIAVSAATSTTLEKGTTVQLTAIGTFTDGTNQDLTKAVTWKTAQAAVATVSNLTASAGLVNAIVTATAGTSTVVISATSTVPSVDGQPVVGNVTLTVNDGKLVSIAVTPAAPKIAAGTALQLKATGTYDDGATQDITNSVTWASDTTATATVNTTDSIGLVAGVAAGNAKITASQGTTVANTISGSVTLTVSNATLNSIALQPHPTATIANGTTQQFTAIGSFSDNTTQDLTDTVTWATSMMAIATISNLPASNGLATGKAEGTSNISASVLIGGVTVTSAIPIPLTVTAATLVSIAITPKPPATALSVPNGATLDLVATGTYTDRSTQDLTTNVNWASATTATATVSNAPHGRAKGAAVGTVDITVTSSAASGSVVGHATLTVTAAIVNTIAITPGATTIVKGHTLQFTAQATMTDGTKQDISATAVWLSETTGTAAISTMGLATGVAAGTSRISASSGGVTSNHVTLTVTN